MSWLGNNATITDLLNGIAVISLLVVVCAMGYILYSEYEKELQERAALQELHSALIY